MSTLIKLRRLVLRQDVSVREATLDPFMQRLRHAADLGRDGLNGSPQRWVLPRCSCTNLTARSRTSGENLFVFFMAQSSQSVEPPRKPERFIGVMSPGH